MLMQAMLLPVVPDAISTPYAVDCSTKTVGTAVIHSAT